MKKILLVVVLIVAVAASGASAAVDAYGKRPWSNARLTTNMKLANAQISLHDRILNRQNPIIRAAREDARSALWVADDTYKKAVEWTLALMDCVKLRDKYEQACIEQAVSAELLPEPYAESYD